jgi:ribosomal protein L14
VFQLYKGSFRRSTLPGFFIKGSARIVEPPRIEYKGFKYKYSLKGDIARLFIARACFRSLYNDGSTVKFNANSAIVIKKKQDPKSKFINGPCSRRLLRRKFLSAFKKVL